MTLSSLVQRAYEPGRAHGYRLSMSMSLLAVFTLTLGFASAAVAVINGDLSQSPTADGCVSKAGAGPCGTDPVLVNPQGIAVSPDGKRVYVASNGSPNAIRVYTRSKPNHGSLSVSTLGAATGLSSPLRVIVSQDGKHVYTSTAGNAIFFFTQDKRTGLLNSAPATCIAKTAGTCPTPAVAQLNGPQGMAISQDGKHVYVAANGADAVLVLNRDKSSGVLSFASCVSEGGVGSCALGKALGGATAVAISKDGKNVYVASGTSNAIAVFTRNKATGALTQLDDPNGCIQDAGDGATCLNGTPLKNPTSVAVSQDGKNVYATAHTSDAVIAFTRGKPTTEQGALSFLGCVARTAIIPCVVGTGLNGAHDVAVSNDGKNVYVASDVSDAVAEFARDTKVAKDGSLSQLADPHDCIASVAGDCTGGKALNGATAVAVSKDGKNVYVSSPGDDAVAVFLRN
jgi:DNA-binding beta-propeller fold protein YncE